jgi:hypothetical protein
VSRDGGWVSGSDVGEGWNVVSSEVDTEWEKLTGMTGSGLVLDTGCYLDVNGPLAQTAKSKP